MHNFQQDIEERSNLTSLNKFELLLFRLGSAQSGERSEIYGINVFKIREIVVMPAITVVAESHPDMMGVVKIRDEIIPVFNLPAIVGCIPNGEPKLLLITEFARTTQAFAVEAVDEIVRLEWSDVLPADQAVSDALITSIAKIDSGTPEARLAQVLDVESILRRFQRDDSHDLANAMGQHISMPKNSIVLAADDSAVARALIESALKALDIRYEMLASGRQLWDRLEQLDQIKLDNKGAPGPDVALVLSDLEMPEMDGFTLTRKIKSDRRFSNIPVIIHSSLSGSANEAHINAVGADAYIAKFVPGELATLLRSFLQA
jgi:two-component system chemotaxis response regulator CheV